MDLRERRDVEHVEEGSLRSIDLLSGRNKMDVRNDFNGTTGNLGRDVKSLEERSLSGFHTSVTSGDVDVVGRDSSSLGGSSHSNRSSS